MINVQPITQGAVTVGRRELLDAFSRRTKFLRAPKHVPTTGLREAALVPALGGFRVEMPGGAHYVWALDGSLTEEIVFDPTRMDWCLRILNLQTAADTVTLRVVDLLLELKCGSSTIKLPLVKKRASIAAKPMSSSSKAQGHGLSPMAQTTASATQRKGHKEILLEISDDLDELFQAAQTAEEDPVWLRLVTAATTVTKMAPYNMMLAKIQRPGATFIAFRDHWHQNGRTVKPGAIPILLLWPFGPVRCAYDLSETTGDEIEDKALSEIFGAPHEVPPNAYTKLVASAKKEDDITVSEEKFSGTLAGRALSSSTVSPKGQRTARIWSVQISQTFNDAAKLATLIHELAHIYLGHLGDKTLKWPNRQILPNEVKEFEAEAVSYIVGKRLGFTTGSAAYLKDYIDDATRSKVSPSAIARVAGRIENYLLR